ncbi:substrate-binding domain-containing protein [Streptomyces sp. MBT65]|uniref:vWA domain-containing protein n=1 Tax=Streptomyces sp. MBT65 TaxID=1488395 RepID=UPI00190C675A|nr:substrate-binding domain-containing protein [Streptomyces sp. MBT65]MBK3579813.1 substrate-binding domain-containing protein [Streptomyces sp. MBT65]
MTRYARTLTRWLALALLAGLTSCGPSSPDVTLRVLASPELADLAPLLGRLKDDTGVELDMEYKATADLAGQPPASGTSPYDLAWLASDRSFLLRLRDSGRTARSESTPIMRSPVVVGLTPALAATLRSRVPGGRLSWADIADAAADGTVRFGMADPRSSDTGRAALVGVATAAAGTGGALREDDVSCDRLRGFRSGQTLTAGSSRALLDTYADHQGEANALIAHESELLSLNATDRLSAPLTIVYPEDGMVLSDFPLLLLNSAEHSAYAKVVTWLLRDDVQLELMRRTWRRPVAPDVRPLEPLRAAVGNALSFPDRLSTVERLVADYGDPTRPTTDQVVFLLDFSTSMRGDRIAQLRAAFAGLSGADPTSTGKFARFYRGERLTVVRFGGRVLDETTVTVRGDGDLRTLRKVVAADGFDDSTAVWSALDRGYRIAADAVRDDPERPLSIVLMTDGRSNAGLGYEQFERHYDRLDAGARAVATFPVHFGEADAAALEKAAEATGGRMVDADRSSLSDAFKEIRGCL